MEQTDDPVLAEDATTIVHVNDVTMRERDGKTKVRLHVTITQIEPKPRWPRSA